MAVSVTLGVAPWLTVAAFAVPLLPVAVFVVQAAHAIAAVPTMTVATTTGAIRWAVTRRARRASPTTTGLPCRPLLALPGLRCVAQPERRPLASVGDRVGHGQERGHPTCPSRRDSN